MPQAVVSPTPGWSVWDLTCLKELTHSFRGDLTEVAAAMGRTRKDCDIALFALVGRSSTEAMLVLGRDQSPRLKVVA